MRVYVCQCVYVCVRVRVHWTRGVLNNERFDCWAVHTVHALNTWHLGNVRSSQRSVYSNCVVAWSIY
jgi:hypothetical protein